MVAKSFAPQIPISQAAQALGKSLTVLRKMDQRHKPFRTIREPRSKGATLWTAPQVLTLRVAFIAADEHDFRLRDTLKWCTKNVLPAFEAVLRGERADATAHLQHPRTGTIVHINLNSGRPSERKA